MKEIKDTKLLQLLTSNNENVVIGIFLAKNEGYSNEEIFEVIPWIGGSGSSVNAKRGDKVSLFIVFPDNNLESDSWQIRLYHSEDFSKASYSIIYDIVGDETILEEFPQEFLKCKNLFIDSIISNKT